jgi:galactokinase
MFGVTPRLYRAPGRVNIIGEHTDYNEGLVMPVGLDLACWVAAASRHDRTITAHSINVNETASAQIDAISTTGTWFDYVAGVAAAGRELGTVSGANLLIDSQVPGGAGLSSSAALEVATALALLDLEGASVDRTTIAQLCQRAENEFVGAAVGIMDHYTAVHARAGSALLLDCRGLNHRFIPLPAEVRIVACNSMVKHSIAAGEYNRRRADCRAAVSRLSQRHPTLSSLRDVELPQLEESRAELGDLLFRRARHIVTENARVMQAADALEHGNLTQLGTLMADSHRSLRADYEVSSRELDLLVELATGAPGVFAARMTGGGFGGCTVNLVHADAVDEFRTSVASGYQAATGIRPDIFVSASADGGGRVDA